MIPSRKIATLFAFFVGLLLSTSTTLSDDIIEFTNGGLSLSDYDSILFTDIRKELLGGGDGASLSDDDDDAERRWRIATDIEWKRSEDDDDDDDDDDDEGNNNGAGGGGLRRGILKNSTFPYIVCEKYPTSGYEFVETVASEFNYESVDSFTNIYNGEDMSCVMIRASLSDALRAKSSSSSSGLLIQPIIPAMKIAAGTVDKIVDKGSRNDNSTVSVHLSALLCPGVSSSTTTSGDASGHAETIGRSIVDAIKRPSRERSVDEDESRSDEEEAILDISKRFLRTSDDDDDDDNNERVKLWKSAFAEALSSSSSDATNDMFSKIFTSRGYKGESFTIGKRLENKKGDRTTTVPIDASPSSLLLLIASIASSRDVCFIEALPKLELLNAESQWIIQSGGRVEEERPWFDAGLDGKGQVVAVSDSGLDMYNCYFWDAEGNVETGGTIKNDGRKVIQYNFMMDDRDDKRGHGTHVCGTVAGRRATTGTTTSESTGDADGIAREAKISFFDIVASDGTFVTPDDYTELFEPGKDAGAFIHSASWGARDNIYDSRARMFDLFTFDNPDFLSIVAAGNTGADVDAEPPRYNIPRSVNTPATAKNVISVGATESYGPELNKPNMIGYDYLAYFSSRGPTADGRTKPDVLAPGYNILSAESYGDDDTYSCGTKFMAGTSMATPAVSGTAALVRQYFMDGWYPSGKPNKDDSIIPSAALMKAVLLNGAQYLKGVSNRDRGVSDVYPYDNVQNYGRISLIDSLYLDGSNNNMNVYIQDNVSVSMRSNKKQSFTTTVVVDNATNNKCASKTISVTIVWTDPPAFPGCRKCGLNDLDLVVTKNRRQSFYPNGRRNKDNANNSERVQMDVEDGDELVVTVVAANLITRAQDYALVMTGCFNVPL